MANLTRREFIKATSMAALAMAVPANIFAADNCTVKTRYGTFNGFIDKQGVKTWLGIPYAQPPVGKLRWQAPQPLKPTDKTFDAKKFGFRAVQIDDGEEGSSTNPQSEDCISRRRSAIDSSFEDSGYLGLKDHVAALQWVKENIAAFGGNPDNITVFGESAGSTAIILLLVAPTEKIFSKKQFRSPNLFFFTMNRNNPYKLLKSSLK